MKKLILDATCGGKQMWFDNAHPSAVYVDKRRLGKGSIPIRPDWSVDPDVVADFRHMPFENDTFSLIVFDPPHIIRASKSDSIIRTKYGELGPDWREVLADGFKECWRVLAPSGTLVVKWGETDKKLGEILKLLPQTPLFGTRTGARGVWLCFMKI